MKSVLLLLTLFALAAAMPPMAEVVLVHFTASEGQGGVRLSWQATQEKGVSHYEVSFRTSYVPDFQLVAKEPARGPQVAYTVEHNDLYKTALNEATYRLEAVLTDGTRTGLGERRVNYTTTAVKRTWGSIKAMFQ